jgi:hypothetical protein
LGIFVVGGGVAAGDEDAPDGDAAGAGVGRTGACARATPPRKSSVRQAGPQRIPLSVFATGLTVKL